MGLIPAVGLPPAKCACRQPSVLVEGMTLRYRQMSAEEFGPAAPGDDSPSAINPSKV